MTRICAEPGCTADISHKPRAKYCDSCRERRIAEQNHRRNRITWARLKPVRALEQILIVEWKADILLGNLRPHPLRDYPRGHMGLKESAALETDPNWRPPAPEGETAPQWEEDALKRLLWRHKPDCIPDAGGRRDVARRKCLRCRTMFTSSWAGNRICPDCKRLEISTEPEADVHLSAW